MPRSDSSRPVFPIGQPPVSPQRPAMIPREKTDFLFYDIGSSGWKRRWDITEHRDGKREGDFHHLHDKFAGEAEEEG